MGSWSLFILNLRNFLLINECRPSISFERSGFAIPQFSGNSRGTSKRCPLSTLRPDEDRQPPTLAVFSRRRDGQVVYFYRERTDKSPHIHAHARPQSHAHDNWPDIKCHSRRVRLFELYLLTNSHVNMIYHCLCPFIHNHCVHRYNHIRVCVNAGARKIIVQLDNAVVICIDNMTAFCLFPWSLQLVSQSVYDKYLTERSSIVCSNFPLLHTHTRARREWGVRALSHTTELAFRIMNTIETRYNPDTNIITRKK